MGTIVGREQLDHPTLGSAGGSALLTSIETIYTNIGNDMPGRFRTYAAIANSTVTTVTHNFGVQFADLNVYIYTGAHPTLTRVANPAASGWTIIANVTNPRTQIDVTAPVSGGPHTFAVFIVHGSLSLDDLTDVDLTTAPQDGQALVYNSAGTQWKPGASGDASFKVQSVATPNASIKGGYLLIDDGRELGTYDGAGSASTDFGTDLTVSLTTILGGAPANATAYYLYLDLNSLGAATTQSDTGRAVYPVTVANFVLSTVSPEFSDMSRFVPRAVIKSATSGTVWSGAGAGFSTLAFLGGQTVDAKLKSSMTLNYIDNPTPERSIGLAITYADAAAATPVDATGGTANVTFTRNTTTPIRGTADYKFSKDAVNRQGQGASIPFTIPATDKNVTARIKFRFNASAANYASGDLSVYIYDVTNSVLISPRQIALPQATMNFETSFDLASGTSYRLALHVASVSALAYDVFLDDFRVDMERLPQGAVVTAPQAYTPTFTGFGTVTNIGVNYARSGSRLKIWGAFKTGTPTGVLAKMSLPTGLTINSVFHTTSQNTVGILVGNGPTSVVAYSQAQTVLMALFDAADNTAVYFASNTDTTANDRVAISQNGGTIFNANSRVAIKEIEVEIAEWAGSGTLSTGQNDVEYEASTTGTWDAAAAAANSVYGPAGEP